MKKAHLVLSCGILVLGLLHIGATTRYFPSLSQAALWFASGGLAMLLTAALNLLSRAYGHVAPGVRRVTVTANVVMTAFASAAGLVGGATRVELFVVIGLFVLTTCVSAWPTPRRHAL